MEVYLRERPDERLGMVYPDLDRWAVVRSDGRRVNFPNKYPLTYDPTTLEDAVQRLVNVRTQTPAPVTLHRADG